MHIEKTPLDFLFHAVLFFLLIHLIITLIRTYLLPYLKLVALEKKNRHQEIIEKDQLLVAMHTRAEGQIKNQKKMFLSLEKNVMHWQEKRILLITQRKETLARIADELAKKQKIQQDYLYIVGILRASYSNIEALLPEQLKNQFENKAHENRSRAVHCCSFPRGEFAVIFFDNSSAKRFACAFLNRFGNLLPEEFFVDLSDFAAFIRKQPILYAYFHITKQDEQLITLLLNKIHANKNCAVYTRKLIELLIKQKRLVLLGSLCEQIVQQNNLQKRRIEVTVFFAHELSQDDRVATEKKIKDSLGQSCLIVYKKDDSLVRGMRIQTDTLLWEHSVRKQLRMLNKKLLLRMLL